MRFGARASAAAGPVLFRRAHPAGAVLERITRTRSSEAFLLGMFMLCVGIAVLTQSLGLSLALGAVLAGFILSESDYSH